jgi:hypothetical protein
MLILNAINRPDSNHFIVLSTQKLTKRTVLFSTYFIGFHKHCAFAQTQYAVIGKIFITFYNKTIELNTKNL